MAPAFFLFFFFFKKKEGTGRNRIRKEEGRGREGGECKTKCQAEFEVAGAITNESYLRYMFFHDFLSPGKCTHRYSLIEIYKSCLAHFARLCLGGGCCGGEDVCSENVGAGRKKKTSVFNFNLVVLPSFMKAHVHMILAWMASGIPPTWWCLYLKIPITSLKGQTLYQYILL